jgi:hypothetical protein
VFGSSLYAFGACYTIITALIKKNILYFQVSQIPANSAFEAPANSAFEAPKAELAAELTDSLENIRYLFEINAVNMASFGASTGRWRELQKLS